MVNRQPTSQGVTIVDLDGTLLQINSLELFLKVAVKYALQHGRIDRVAAILTLYLLRKGRIISHESMKYKAIACAGKSQAMLGAFGLKARKLLNRRVLNFIGARRRQGDKIIVASAAAESYVGRIWSGDFIASPAGGPDCRGVRKREAVAAHIAATGLRLNYFLTDHCDDLPLAHYAADNGATVILVRPQGNTRERFEAELPREALIVI